MDPVVSALGGVTRTAILLVFVLSGIIYFTQQNGSGRAKMPGWESSGGLRQPTWSFGPPYWPLFLVGWR
jgi:hypothetical protein